MFIAICFRGEDAYRWEEFETLALAEAACAGVLLCNLDDFVGYVYDVANSRLVCDDSGDPWMRPRIASAEALIADIKRLRAG